MPRIRTVKPEFWGDEKLAPMTPIDRLVFLGLVGMADDTGRLLDSVKVVDAFVFPYTEDTSGPSLESLASAGRIIRGITASGQRVIQITNWSKHQKVDHPNLKSCLPEIVAPQEHSVIREEVARDSRAVRAPTYDLRPVPTTNDRRPSSDLPPAVLDAASGYLNVQREARIGMLRGMLQGISDHPVPENVLVRALRDMTVANADFRPVVLRTWCTRAEKEIQGEHGRQFAANPTAQVVEPGTFDEDEAGVTRAE